MLTSKASRAGAGPAHAPRKQEPEEAPPTDDGGDDLPPEDDAGDAEERKAPTRGPARQATRGPAPLKRDGKRRAAPGRAPDAGEEDEEREIALDEKDPRVAKMSQEEKRNMLKSMRSTEEARRRLAAVPSRRVDLGKREATMVTLADLNLAACHFGNAAKEDAKHKGLFRVDNQYGAADELGPTVQFRGRLRRTPMKDALYDRTNLSVEITDPKEQEKLYALDAFFASFPNKARQEKWKMGKTQNYNSIFTRGKIKDPALQEKYGGGDPPLPANLLDPESGKKIEFYPPKVKGHLVWDSKNPEVLVTEVTDANDDTMNPYDLRGGNEVLMGVTWTYTSFKQDIKDPFLYVYGPPSRLVQVKQLDKSEGPANAGGGMKRYKWAPLNPAEPPALASNAPPNLPSQPLLVAAAPAAGTPAPPAPPGGPSEADPAAPAASRAPAPPGGPSEHELGLRAKIAAKVAAGKAPEPRAGPDEKKHDGAPAPASAPATTHPTPQAASAPGKALADKAGTAPPATADKPKT
jgi:hypothetical protein